MGKPAFVFVHGWSCDRSFFAPQVEHFSRQHRVVAVDLRGHGESDKPQGVYRIADYADDTAYIVDQLGFGKVVAVGHSSGAWTVMQLAALHPEHRGGNRDGRSSAIRDDTGTPRECRGDGGSNGTRGPGTPPALHHGSHVPADIRPPAGNVDTECDAGHASPRGRLCHAGRTRIRWRLPSRRNARSPRYIWRRPSLAIHRHATRRI